MSVINKSIKLGTALFKAAKPEFEQKVKLLNTLLTYARKNPENSGLNIEDFKAIENWLNGSNKTTESLHAYKIALNKLKQVVIDTKPKTSSKTPKVKSLNDLTDKEFELYVLKQIPLADHFPNLSSGATPEEFSNYLQEGFNNIGIGQRLDLGSIFSGESTRALLPYVRRKLLLKKARVYIPEDKFVYTNDAAGKYSPLLVVLDLNTLFGKLYESLGMPYYSSVQYIPESNKYLIPGLSFIRTAKKGLKLIKKCKR